MPASLAAVETMVPKAGFLRARYFVAGRRNFILERLTGTPRLICNEEKMALSAFRISKHA